MTSVKLQDGAKLFRHSIPIVLLEYMSESCSPAANWIASHVSPRSPHLMREAFEVQCELRVELAAECTPCNSVAASDTIPIDNSFNLIAPFPNLGSKGSLPMASPRNFRQDQLLRHQAASSPLGRMMAREADADSVKFTRGLGSSFVT